MGIEFHWLRAGECSHPEFVTLSKGRFASVRFPNHFGFLRHPKHGNILFDTGYSSHFFDATSAFPEKIYSWVTPVHCQPHQSAAEHLKRLGVMPSQINAVVLSHFHADHMAGARDFPNSRFFCSRHAWESMASRSRLGNLSQGVLPALLPHDFLSRTTWIEDLPRHVSFGPFAVTFDLFADASILAIPLPGHAPGQIGLQFCTSEQEIFLVADAVWHSATFQELRFPNPLVRLLTAHHKSYVETIEKLHDLHAKNPNLSILATHCAKNRQSRA